MKPAEFKKAWSGHLCKAPRKAASQLRIPKEDQQFLATAGLPICTADEFVFERLEDGEFPALDEAEDTDGFGPEFHRYRIIGEGAYGEPICVDEKGQGAVFIYGEEQGEMIYLNSSIRTLARALLAFEQDRDSDEPNAEQCREAIREFDPRAIAEGSYWAGRLDVYAEEDGKPPLDLSDDGSMEFEHPLLGKLAGGGETWEGETDRLRKFSACGWNEPHVSAHLHPGYNDAGKRVKPPAGEKFAPKAKPPKAKAKTIEFVIECEEGMPPTEAQNRAIEHLFQNEGQLLAMIAVAVRKHVEKSDIWEGRETHLWPIHSEVRKHVEKSDFWEWMLRALGDQFPKLSKLLDQATGWLSLIDIRSIRVSNKTRKGKIVIGCDCNCVWDEEHGLGFQFTEDRVIKVGHGTVGWNIYDS